VVWTGTISSKGQLTIPKPVREALGLEPGTKVLFVLREGKVELEVISGDIRQWQGALKEQDTGASPEKVREHVRRAIAEEVVRETQGN
jgi:AbrB family looped-hinge helix DNA binding protein